MNGSLPTSKPPHPAAPLIVLPRAAHPLESRERSSRSNRIPQLALDHRSRRHFLNVPAVSMSCSCKSASAADVPANVCGNKQTMLCMILYTADGPAVQNNEAGDAACGLRLAFFRRKRHVTCPAEVHQEPAFARNTPLFLGI